MIVKFQHISKKYGELLRRSYGIVILFIFLLCILIRAHCSAITLDEAHTYVSYVKSFHIKDIGGFFENYDGRANNHLLNTVLIYLVDRLIGIHYDEFLIRIPSICFGFVFGGFCFYLYKKREITIFEFSLLMLNTILNYAFSMARGYGMATCLTMIAIYFLKCFVDSNFINYKFLTLAICFLTAAELANTVVLLITGSAAILLFFIMLIKKTLVSYLKNAWLFLIPLGIINLLLFIYHLYISIDGDNKELATYHGNPLNGIIGSFVGMYMDYFAMGFTCILAGLLIAAFIYGIVKKKNLFFVDLFVIYFVMCTIAYILLKKGMPSGWSLLPTCPIIIFSIGEILGLIYNEIIKIFIPKNSRLVLGTSILIGFSFIFDHFVRTVDFTINNDLRMCLYDSIMGSYNKPLDSEELNYLHKPFYQKQFLYRYGYDVYYKKYTLESMSLRETLQMIENKQFDALIKIDNRDIFVKYVYEFSKLGVDVKSLPDTVEFILLKRGGGTTVEYIDGFNNSDNIQDTILGTLTLFYGDNDSYGVYMDGYECLVVKPEELEPDISICIWNNGNEEPMDYKLYVEE